ncbi:hypothetical protein Gpo141_00003142 [Globisporangium polare]
MAAPTTATVPIKLCYMDSVFRSRVNVPAFRLVPLQRLAASTFNLSADSLTLKYTDPEGDLVTLTSDEDLGLALQLFESDDAAAATYSTIRFTVIPSAGAVFKENVVEPVVKAMESLIETLDAAKENMKKEEWVQRAQTNAHVRNEVLKSAVSDARESLQAACKRIQEIPFDQMAKDASTGIQRAASSAAVKAKEVVEDAKQEKIVQDAAESIKNAAVGISKFAKDTVEDVKKDQNLKDVAEGLKTAAEGLGEVAKEAVGELKSKVAPYFTQTSAAVAPVSTDAGESEWEQVAEPAATAAVEEEEEIVEVVVSEEEKKWADQLATIREIIPGADSARAIAQLELANGNVEVVLNALMEEM